MTFSPNDRATWPELLTADEVAAIFRRQVSGLKKACQQRRFVPSPIQVRPYLWRRKDILRRLDAERTELRKVG